MRLTDRLLRKNTSPARLAGFILSNFIGLLIVGGAMMFYADARSIWEDEDSFIRTDYLVVNKKVTSASTLGEGNTHFTSSDISDLNRQPWVRGVGRFVPCDYRVYASVNTGGRGMETALFFESIPDSFVDVSTSDWHYSPADEDVPIIISKDYLTLYNFGFASSAGMPQLSEQLLQGIPLQLYLRSEEGDRSMRVNGRIVGFSSRLNTVLVPESFMSYTNSMLGSGAASSADASRLIIDVSSPGDVAISRYLDAKGWEIAGDKSASQASYLLKVATGIVAGIGAVIMVLSFFILMLSISLLMEKNRDKIHQLLMLGCSLGSVGVPYVKMIVAGCTVAWAFSVGALLFLRGLYLPALEGLGGEGSGWIWAVASVTCLSLIVTLLNIMAVRRKISSAWAMKRSGR